MKRAIFTAALGLSQILGTLYAAYWLIITSPMGKYMFH